MKNLYLIGGTMGVGKSTVSQALKHLLPDCVLLDGDNCWDADPFTVTDETKAMVLDNITHLLSNFLACTAYHNIVFCWVMHEEEIISSITDALDLSDCRVIPLSLICDAGTLTARLTSDIERGKRNADIIPRSTARLPMYERLPTIKIDTTGKTVDMIAREISAL